MITSQIFLYLSRLDKIQLESERMRKGRMPGRKPGSIINEQLSAYFAKIGRKGGKARLQTMTAAERKAIAKKAVAAREAKRKDKTR